MISLQVGASGETIVLPNQVLEHFWRNRQFRWWHREAGGSLFARIEQQLITIEAVTGPRPTDQRTRYSYSPDRLAEQREIEAFYKHDLHYVGDWHTHPEKIPVPSGTDERTMASRVLESKHQLRGFVFAIVGNGPLPDGLTVVVHDGTQWYPLQKQGESAA